ncbi:dTDP-glucose 4,6-dehydratase [Piscirickettsia litoralis]|uniref:dTDP-glucose 4,6-dehydratase n=1 Tax=Piscirickettsia litoralis TaxID=1891921 RepID=A0ABX3A288_9GAMM|nr:dTDP-glucose 4,6-dehydratase [Piscirickettsia litoralis]ODN42977.1 dTDP-glucose 4,6-dehydratase [Piscirickettsia litoralis]
MKQQLLVTGAAGFIGCNFVRYMLKTHRNIHIISLDKLTYAGSLDNLKNLPDESRHTFVQGDICDRTLVDQLLREHNIDTIAHFAAESHVDNSIEDPGVFVETNVMGTFTLLESARKFWLEEKKWTGEDCRFHHVSTDEVYGALSKEDPAFTEATAYAPNSPYSASKAGSDHLVRAYFHTYGLPVTTSNCSNNYGPYQHSEKLIPTVIRSCLAEKEIPVYGNGSNIRDWLYVEDHCSAIDTIIRKGKLGEVYNVGGNNEVDNLALIKTICQILDEKQPRKNGKSYQDLITFVTDRAGHDLRYAIDDKKIAYELGWQPVHKLSSALNKVIDLTVNL